MLIRIFTVLTCISFALSCSVQANAKAIDVSALQVSMLGDTELSCGQLSREAEAMRDFIADQQITRDDTRMTNSGISAAGAVGSLLLGTATGGLGLAAAGYMAREVNNEEDTNADKLQDIAEQRRSFMIGIFNAKGCEGPIEHVMQDRKAYDPVQQVLDIIPSSGPENGQKRPQFNQ